MSKYACLRLAFVAQTRKSAPLNTVRPRGSDYLVIGHESLGEVIEAGPAVSRVNVGDLVVLTVRRPCPHPECHPCRAGYPDFCITGDYTERGIKGAHGFMTEEVVDHERYLHVVPPRAARCRCSD